MLGNAWLINTYPDSDPKSNGTAFLVVMFGIMSAANVATMAPDQMRGKMAGIKIFSILETPSKINAVDKCEPAADSRKLADDEHIKGMIEFKKVWFRYPSKPNVWIFKGLNLKIYDKTSVACVGESGSGKSTFINLVMRFYDPDFGQVLIDGIDIKKYDVRQLRARMGLVMQEPTLFNCSLKENFLYGNQKASNKEIMASARDANAAEFIETAELGDLIDNNATAIYEEISKTENKKKAIKNLGDEGKYNEMIGSLLKLKAVEASKAGFKPLENALDNRTPE
jgi:ATP-binding cassette subfamily B (MDR/TAP) protein 1